MYRLIHSEDVPTRWYCLSDIVFDDGEVVELQLFAGRIGITCTSSNDSLNGDGSGFLGILMPVRGWQACQSRDPYNS